MKLLADFEQAKVLGSAASVNYGCCLAFSLEWVRLALYKYKSSQQSDAKSRMALLTSEAKTIATYQGICNDFTIAYGKPKPDMHNANPKASKPHQHRQCYILNMMGDKKDVVKEVDAEL